MSPITFTENNNSMRRNLVAVASMLTAMSVNNYEYEVRDVYFDIGQNWMWTTIVCYSDDSSWQVLNPNEWEHICFASNFSELAECCEELKNGKYWLDK